MWAFSRNIWTGSGAPPPAAYSVSTCKSFWGLKWLGCEVDCCLTGAEVKNKLGCATAPLMPPWQVWLQLHRFTYVPVYIFCGQISWYNIADIMFCCVLPPQLVLLLPQIIIINTRLVIVVCRNIVIIFAFVCEGGLVFSCIFEEAVISQTRITGSEGILTSGIF